jgi:DNA repair protein RecO (recombination protein O)
VSLVTTPAILLRTHPYSETSQVLRFYSRDMGVLAVLAKGVRKAGGRRGGGPSTFGQGDLTLFHRENRELQTFKEFSPGPGRKRGLGRDPLRFAGASVLGELVLQHAGSDRNPGLFSLLSAGLDAVDVAEEEGLITMLLREVWSMIRELGYAPSIERCVACGGGLGREEVGRFDFAEGGTRCPRCQEGSHGPRLGPHARKQLESLLQGNLPADLQRPKAHLRLASDFITYHISGGAPLRSLQVLETLIPKDHA